MGARRVVTTTMPARRFATDAVLHQMACVRETGYAQLATIIIMQARRTATSAESQRKRRCPTPACVMVTGFAAAVAITTMPTSRIATGARHRKETLRRTKNTQDPGYARAAATRTLHTGRCATSVRHQSLPEQQWHR